MCWGYVGAFYVILYIAIDFNLDEVPVELAIEDCEDIVLGLNADGTIRGSAGDYIK